MHQSNRDPLDACPPDSLLLSLFLSLHVLVVSVAFLLSVFVMCGLMIV